MEKTCELLSAEQVRERLREACQEAGGARAWGIANGIDEGQLSRVLRGLQGVSEKIGECVGAKKVWITDDKLLDTRANAA